jgi:hypothetical protein
MIYLWRSWELLHNFCGYHSITSLLYYFWHIYNFSFYSGDAATVRYSIKVATQFSSRGWVHPEFQAQSRKKTSAPPVERLRDLYFKLKDDNTIIFKITRITVCRRLELDSPITAKTSRLKPFYLNNIDSPRRPPALTKCGHSLMFEKNTVMMIAKF